MGRKSKGKKSGGAGQGSSQEAPKPLSKQAKKEISENIKTLLEKCSHPLGTGSKELEEYEEIRDLIEKIRALQTEQSLPWTNRESSFPKFLDWLNSNNVDASSVEMAPFEAVGYGLRASKDVKENEVFLSIPRSVMMTTASAKASALGPLMGEDKILQVMPSVVLALHLLCELRSPESIWRPYLDILPESYSTPLYFTTEELKYLKGSPALTDCITQYRNIARQYGYFFRLFQNDALASNLPIKEFFTFDDYRWAVSTVMTRQNQIPTPGGDKMTFALIPLWDMCNHCNGLITTDFNLEKDCSECYALKNYCKNDQIFIFYGARSNAELLVNNGFVYPDNEHDRLAIKLGISKGDQLFDQKSEVLTKCGLLPSRTFFLHTGEYPVDLDLLVFLRVFCMDEDHLKSYLASPAEDVKQELSDLDKVISLEVDGKMWNYMETRASLLLKAYETTIEEDEEILKKDKLSEGAVLAVQLRICEKKILQSTVKYCSEKKESLEAAGS